MDKQRLGVDEEDRTHFKHRRSQGMGIRWVRGYKTGPPGKFSINLFKNRF